MIRYRNRHKRLAFDNLARIFFVDNLKMVEYMQTHEQEDIFTFLWLCMHGIVPFIELAMRLIMELVILYLFDDLRQ